MNELAGAIASLAARIGVHASSTAVDGSSRNAQRIAGEQAAAGALAAVGSADLSVLGRADDGCPLWPRGFVGSIAHTASTAVAVAARGSDAVAAVGVDIEESAALPAEDAAVVLGDDERAVVDAHGDPDWYATLMWSVKEAAFKAWSAACGGLGTVDPVDISVSLDPITGVVGARATGSLEKAVEPFGEAIGAYVEAAGCVVTLVRVAAPTEAG